MGVLLAKYLFDERAYAMTTFHKNLLIYGVFVLFVAILASCIYWMVGNDAKIPVELRVWQFFAVFVTMVLVNLAVLFVLISVMRWKATVENGMMAIVPSAVVEETKETGRTAKQTADDVSAAFGEISKHLKSTSDSIHILKHELKLREDELAQLKNGAAQAEKEKIANKLAKIHSFLSKLEAEVAEKRMDTSAAIKFLNGELEDLFDEFGLYELKIAKGSQISGIEGDSYVIKSYEPTADPNQNMTVAMVVEQGYGATRSNGTRRIVKPSIVIIKKLGE